MDSELCLVLVLLSRDFMDLPAHAIVTAVGAALALMPDAHPEVVDDEVRLILERHRQERRAAQLHWEWTAEDDAAWQIPDEQH